jgi:hypothetical protein
MVANRLQAEQFFLDPTIGHAPDRSRIASLGLSSVLSAVD